MHLIGLGQHTVLNRINEVLISMFNEVAQKAGNTFEIKFDTNHKHKSFVGSS